MKRVIFDAGMVLFYPKSGEWFFPTAYFDYCKNNSVELVTDDLKKNYANALMLLDNKKMLSNIQEEEELFRDFYKALFKHIPEKDATDLIEKCVWGKVHDPQKYIMYDDVQETLEHLSKDYKLGVISDAWPSLINVFKHNDIEKYFDTIIISTEVGFSKKEDTIFTLALEKFNNKADECVFIDDSINNCLRAKSQRIESIVLDRKNDNEIRSNTGLKYATNMEEIIEYIKNYPTNT